MWFKKIVKIVPIIFLLGIKSFLFTEGNLLINPSFEGEFDEKGIAYGWADNSAWAPVKVIYSKETVDPLDGKSAQRIECISYEGGTVQFINKASIKAKTGKVYKLSVWMKGKVNAPVEIVLRQRDYPFKTLIGKSFIVGDTWKEYIVEDVAPFDEENCWFMIKFRSTGVLWVDKAYCIEVGEAKYEKINLPPNLIDNGSFELGLNGWIYTLIRWGSYKYLPKIEFLDPKPVIDNSTFVHGNKSLKISVLPNSSLILTTSYYKINPNSEYTISLWMKSEPPGMRVRFGVGGGNYFMNPKSITTEVIRLTNEWKKYDFNLTLPPIFENSYYLLIRSFSPGILWVDGVVFGERNNIKGENFIPKHSIEISLHSDREDNLYFEGEDIKIVLNCYRYIEEKIRDKEEIEYKILDVFGKEVGNGKTTINLSSDKYYEKPLITTKLPIGWYKIIAKLVGKEDIFDECLIGVVPKRETSTKSLNSPFGGHLAANAYYLGIGEKMGVKWMRLHPPLFTKWMVAEDTQGEFSWFDEIVEEINKHNMYILGSLDATPKWAATYPEEDPDKARRYPPRDLKDWENYVEAVLKHYKDIKYWEVWNEPEANNFFRIYPEDKLNTLEEKAKVYVSLLKSAYKVAKKIDPNIKIVGGVGCQPPITKWIQLIAAEGAFDYMDILSFHIYKRLPYEELKKIVDDIQNEMKKYGRMIPIWNTEAGFGEVANSYTKIKQVSPFVQYPPEMACSYIIKNYVLHLSVGIEKLFYYSIYSSERIDYIELRSILECDRKPRPSLVTYSVLSWLLEGKKFVNRQTIDEVEIYEFKDGNEKILVVWAKKNKKNIEIPVENKNVVVYNFIGGKEEYKKKGEKIEIVVDDFPKLIRIFE